MVRRALIGLTALVSVASAQPIPNATWTLTSPRTAPTVEWSPDGKYVALSTDSSVEVLDGMTYKVLWSRKISGALPSFLSIYPQPDRAHFAMNSLSIYVRTAAGGNYTQIGSRAGNVIRSFSFPDWTGDYVLRPVVGGVLVALKLGVSSGTETIDVRTYSEKTLELLKTRTASHAYVAGVQIPAGNFNGKPYVGFYGKLLNCRSTIDSTWDSGSIEAYNVGFDPDGGVVQTVVNGSTALGTQHVNAAGAVTWTNGSLNVNANLAFVKSGTAMLGMNPTGSAVQVFDYTSGSPLYTSDLGLGGSAFTMNRDSVHPLSGRFITSAGTAGNMAAGVYMADESAATFQGVSFALGGVAKIAATADHGVFVSGSANYYSSLGKGGTIRWGGTGNTAAVGYSVSRSSMLAALLTPTGIAIVDADDGSPMFSYAGSYTRVLWIKDTGLVAIKADGTADRLDVGVDSITLHGTLPMMFQGGAGAVTSSGTWAIGYGGGNMHLYNLTGEKDHLQAYPQYVAGWENFFKVTALSSTKIGLLEKSGSDYKWQLYDLALNKLNASSSLSYSMPGAGWLAGSFRSDVTKNATSAVSAFFSANGNAIDGTPTSQLSVVRVSDGRVLSTYDNVFSAINDMQFSDDGSSLYVATGGGVDDGPQELVALPVPSWLSGITVTPGTATGGTVDLKVTLAVASPATRTKVLLSVSPSGPTIPAFIYLNGGVVTSPAVHVALPAVTSDTTYTFTAMIEGTTDTVSTMVNDLTPVPASASVAFDPFGHGSTSQTLKVTLTGKAPVGGTVVNLSSSVPSISVPATVTVPEGATTATVPVTSYAAVTSDDVTFTATVGSTSVTCTTRANRTTVSGLTLTPASVMAGTGSTGKVTISGAAGPGGATVTLSSSLSGTSVPASVTIPEGSTNATFPITTQTASSASSPVITATYGTQNRTATLTVTQTTLSSLTLSPTSVTAGASSTATVTIATAATTGGFPVALTYSGTGVSGPATVTVAEGATTATYTVTTTAALTGQATGAGTTATAGASSKTAALTITPTTVTAFNLTNASITGGSNSTGSITISSPAPTGGLVVTLTNNNTAVLTVPANITVPAGATSVNFSWPSTPTLTSVNATLTAKIASAGPTAVQQVIPPKVISVAFSPSTVTGGSSSTITVTLNGPAPAGYGITLVSSNSARMTFALSPIKPNAGATTATGTANTTAGAATTATVTANGPGGNGTANATLTIN